MHMIKNRYQNFQKVWLAYNIRELFVLPGGDARIILEAPPWSKLLCNSWVFHENMFFKKYNKHNPQRISLVFDLKGSKRIFDFDNGKNWKSAKMQIDPWSPPIMSTERKRPKQTDSQKRPKKSPNSRILSFGGLSVLKKIQKMALTEFVANFVELGHVT